eukprot:362496-Chlamydomonas_euryale.AAC.2
MVPWPEDMQRVLTVRDEEVDAPRAQRRDGGTCSGGNSGGGGAQQEAGMSERALKQMMGGTLAGKEDDKDPFALERPEWMDGNPKLFSSEQQQKLKVRADCTQTPQQSGLRWYAQAEHITGRPAEVPRQVLRDGEVGGLGGSD